MARLLEQQFLFFDAQTTGMRPPTGRLIELGWSFGSASEDSRVEAQKFALPEGQSLPKKVSEITGLSDNDLANMPTLETWTKTHFLPWLKASSARCAMIHYAQFEIPYLRHMLQTGETDELPFTVLCTHQITRRLFPKLPSQNIRAVAGFFGHPMLGPNRAGEFVRATQVIWRGLTEELEKLGLAQLEDLVALLKAPTEKKKREISYRIPQELRLNLPDQPGIYRMLAKTGEVLYVGKATSLKDRVNSYFRGVKGREKRKLEMLAQTWDLQVEVCGSPLEAALRESDEIKRLSPRYNVSLKKEGRSLCFYSEDFGSSSPVQSEFHPIGPFRPNNLIDMVGSLWRSLAADEFEQIFFEPIDPQLMRVGFALFLKNHGLDPGQIRSQRSLLAYGLKLHRLYKEPSESEDVVEPTEPDEDIELTAEDLAGKFERLLRRAGRELVRAKQLTGILHADVEFLNKNEWRTLALRCNKNQWPWSELDIEAFDRASILLSELSRLTHRIVRHPR